MAGSHNSMLFFPLKSSINNQWMYCTHHILLIHWRSSDNCPSKYRTRFIGSVTSLWPLMSVSVGRSVLQLNFHDPISEHFIKFCSSQEWIILVMVFSLLFYSLAMFYRYWLRFLSLIPCSLFSTNNQYYLLGQTVDFGTLGDQQTICEYSWVFKS